MKQLFSNLIFYFCIIILLSSYPIVPNDIVISNVQYLQPETYTFSKPSNIFLSNGKIIGILPNLTHKEEPMFLIPSFCDGGVHLGMNSLGTAQSYDGLKTALRAFLFHGFTTIHSIGDGEWIQKIKTEIDSGKLLGPEIIISRNPILSKSPETEEIPEYLYKKVSNQIEFVQKFNEQLVSNQRIIHIYHRYSPESKYNFESISLNQIYEQGKSSNKLVSVTTFADRHSIIETLTSGIRYMYHPIPDDLFNDLTDVHFFELKWSPMFMVYNFIRVQENLDLLSNVHKSMTEDSSFFKKYYSEEMKSNFEKKSHSPEELSLINGEFESYKRFISKRLELTKTMFLSSGSGHHFTYSGISGLMELEFLNQFIKSDKLLLKIPTENTCQYLGGIYKGRIQIGHIGNLILLEENPFQNIKTLYKIKSIYVKGKKIDPNSL